MEDCDEIPWSQQVDEASYENLPSLIEPKSPGYSSSIQFQNPPFGAQSEVFTNERSKKTYSNDSNVKNTKQFYSNESKRYEVSEKKLNTPRSIYHMRRDNAYNSNQHMPKDSYKPALGDIASERNEDRKVSEHSPSNDFNLNKKKITWASVASQPAQPNKKNGNVFLKKKGPGMPPPPMIPGKHNLDISAWDVSNNVSSPGVNEPESPTSFGPNEGAIVSEDDVSGKSCRPPSAEHQHYTYNRKQPNFFSNRSAKNIKVNNKMSDFSRDRRYISKYNGEVNQNSKQQPNKNCISNCKENFDDECAEKDTSEDNNSYSNNGSPQSDTIDVSSVVLQKLRDRNNYNPAVLDLEKAALSRFFVIKSYSEDDIHRSIKYEIWCSTDHGNKRLDEAFKERVRKGGHVMLFFSVNGSGHFCGMAQMMTSVDYNSTSTVWSQDKWKGKFKVKWIYVKDVPNSLLWHIRLENNDNKSVTHSRDAQEVLNSKGLQVLQIVHEYKHPTSIFDDFYHYEKKQEEAVLKKPIQHDGYSHRSSSASSNTTGGHNDIKEQHNFNRFSGNFRERVVFHRGGGYHHTSGNRRYGKGNDIQNPNKDDKDRPTSFINQERGEQQQHQQMQLHHHHQQHNNESDSYNRQSHKNASGPEDNSCSNLPNRNYKDIILHMNNFDCSDNIVEGESETKSS